MTKPKNIGTAAVLRLLRDKYAPPAWALFEELRNGTGWQRHVRTADAVALGLWPSRGLELLGFEVKISRADLLAQLRNPAKSTEIQKYCDRWWLVLADASLIKPGELPPNWGLMVVRGTKQLRAVTEAPKLRAKKMDRAFLASMIRQVHKTHAPRAELDEAIAAIDEKAKVRAGEMLDAETSRLQRAQKHNAKIIAEFEEASGVRLSEWNAADVGGAVKFVINADVDRLRRQMEGLANQHRRLAEQVEKALAGFDEGKTSNGND